MREQPSDADREAVTRLLGREPLGLFRVVVRNDRGEPVVLENHPLLEDGSPMPTRFWLVGTRERRVVGRLEAVRGVARAQAAVDPDALAACHAAYAREREAQMPKEHAGPRPMGGVGGTRQGVKCLHAHYAHLLAGGDDPVGEWVVAHLHEVEDIDSHTPRRSPVTA